MFLYWQCENKKKFVSGVCWLSNKQQTDKVSNKLAKRLATKQLVETKTRAERD